MSFADLAPRKRQEGSDGDIRYVVVRLRQGMPWEKAILGAWPPIELDWFEEHKKYIIAQVNTDRWRKL
jgi:hypothetical protein